MDPARNEFNGNGTDGSMFPVNNYINTNATTNSAITTATKTNQSSYFLQKDYDTSYDESTASKIELSGSSAKVSGDGVTVSGSTVTITKSGTYVISGQSDGVQIKVEADKSADAHLV